MFVREKNTDLLSRSRVRVRNFVSPQFHLLNNITALRTNNVGNDSWDLALALAKRYCNMFAAVTFGNIIRVRRMPPKVSLV